MSSDSEEEGPAGGAAREGRLRAAVKQLKARLELLNAENTQLEELLKQADTRAAGAEGKGSDKWFIFQIFNYLRLVDINQMRSFYASRVMVWL